MPVIKPVWLVLALLPPAVSVELPNAMVPAPAIEPIVWAKLARSQVARLSTVIVEVAGRMLIAPLFRVPPLTVVPPVCRFPAGNTTVPPPSFVSAPVDAAMAPSKVSVPVETSIDEVLLLASVIQWLFTLAAPLRSKVPPSSATTLVPRLA